MIKPTRGGKRSTSGKFNTGYKDNEDYRTFKRENMKDFKAAGIRSDDAAVDEWYKTRMDATAGSLKDIGKEESVDIIKDKVPENLRRGWFVEANSEYKPKILDNVMKDGETRNAALNIAYQNYKSETGKNISYEKFLNTPVTMYRGTKGQKTVKDDKWHSFSYSKDIATKFGSNVQTIKIKPKDTFGSLQTTGETEVLVPDFMLRKMR